MFDKKNYKNLFTKTNLIITFLGILPAAGYVIGISYYQGRLSAYGVSSDTFPLALQDIYVEAFWAVGRSLLQFAGGMAAIVNKALTLPGLFLTIGLLLSVTCIAYLPIKYKSSIRLFLRVQLQPLKKVFNYLDSEKNAFTKALSITGGYSYVSLSVVLVILLLALCWVGIPILAYGKGQEDSTAMLNQYLEKGCFVKDGEKWSNCKKLISSDGKQIYEGILVAHTNGYVAFFNNSGSYVTKFPENSVIVSDLSK